MKRTLTVLLLILFTFSVNMFAQNIFSEQKIISTTASDPSCVYSVDIDGDNDLDVVACSYYGGKVMWYENKDGKGAFSSPRTVVGNEGHANSVLAADIDGDSDIDVLPTLGTNEVVWYENIDSKGNFGNKKIISLDVLQTSQIIAFDLDDDEYLDVISASYRDNKITWYRNIDGKGNFGEQQIISTNVNGPWSIFAADLDNDYDLDILSLSRNDDKVAWYENTDSKGKFSSQKVISTSADAVGSPNTIYAIDLDGDERKDVLTATQNDDKIAWYKNLGDGSFSAQRTITTNADGASSVYACDIDNDGDQDVLSSSKFDDKIAWYKNLTNPTSAKNNKSELLNNFQLQQNYPNPFNPYTMIKYNLHKPSNVMLKIYNLSGQELEVLINEFQTSGEHIVTWQPKGLPSGIYFYKLQAGDPSTSSPWKNTGQAGQRFSETMKLILQK